MQTRVPVKFVWQLTLQNVRMAFVTARWVRSVPYLLTSASIRAIEAVRGIPQFLHAHCGVLRSAYSASCCKRRLNEPELNEINSI